MKLPALFYFFFPLAVALLSVWLIGVNLGGAFAIVVTAAILCPLAASSDRAFKPSIIAAVLASLGAASGSASLLLHEAFTPGQVAAIGLTVVAFGLALAGLARLLIAIRFSPTVAGAIVTLLAMAWLGWPIWLSPWLGFHGSDAVVARLTAVHPLLAINAIAPQFGYWPQSRYMYSLTGLSQDVLLSLPGSTLAVTAFHLIVAGVALLLLGGWRVVGNQLCAKPTS